MKYLMGILFSLMAFSASADTIFYITAVTQSGQDMSGSCSFTANGQLIQAGRNGITVTTDQNTPDITVVVSCWVPSLQQYVTKQRTFSETMGVNYVSVVMD